MPTRDKFSPSTRARLAKRAGFLCSICGAFTVGASEETVSAVSNIGIAAHIAGASPRGPRYDLTMSASMRSSITNGIWLCQNHAKTIDDDTVTWTVTRLQQVKAAHEKEVKERLGIPRRARTKAEDKDLLASLEQPASINLITPSEYAFLPVAQIAQPYKSFISPVLIDKKLTDDMTLGVLMCGSSLDEPDSPEHRPQWTVFVDAKWLQWTLDGKKAGYDMNPNVSPKFIYGRIPAWPDSFFEFLEAIVQTDTTFAWTRHRDGYLVLAQQPRPRRRSPRRPRGKRVEALSGKPQ